jgi:ubiquinone/menaquinone biosynthesis C-methylase UbiE
VKHPPSAGSLRILLGGGADSVDHAWESIISDVHRATPGCTSRGLRNARDPRGRSSYEVLADSVPAGAALIADIGCGDGEMAMMLRRRGGARVLGVDRSWPETTRARSRLGIGAAALVGDASRLPISDGVLDAAVCHMALMLFADLPSALEQLARTLRPSGTFASIVQSSPARSGGRIGTAAAQCGAAMRSWWLREIGDLPDTRAGAQLADPAMLAAAFTRAGLTQPRWEPVTVTIHAAADQVWAEYLANLYLIRALGPAENRCLRQVAIDVLSEHAGSDGRVRFDVALGLLTARKAGDAGQ